MYSDRPGECTPKKDSCQSFDYLSVSHHQCLVDGFYQPKVPCLVCENCLFGLAVGDVIGCKTVLYNFMRSTFEIYFVFILF